MTWPFQTGKILSFLSCWWHLAKELVFYHSALFSYTLFTCIGLAKTGIIDGVHCIYPKDFLLLSQLYIKDTRCPQKPAHSLYFKMKKLPMWRISEISMHKTFNQSFLRFQVVQKNFPAAHPQLTSYILLTCTQTIYITCSLVS